MQKLCTGIRAGCRARRLCEHSHVRFLPRWEAGRWGCGAGKSIKNRFQVAFPHTWGVLTFCHIQEPQRFWEGPALPWVSLLTASAAFLAAARHFQWPSAEYLVCAAHREMEEEKGEGLTPSPSSSPRPTGVQGPPGRSLCQRAGGGTVPSPHPRHPHTVLVPPSPLSHHTLWLAVGACPGPQEEVACPRGSWHSPQPCCLPGAAGRGRSRHRSPQHHVRELRASSLHPLCAAFQACAVVRKGLFGV